MIKNFLMKLTPLVLFLGALWIQSCKDDWNTHYNTVTSQVTDMKTTEYINEQTDLSIFYEMLKLTGYDSILNQSQTYTVWAPDNNALKDVDLNDMELVLNLVKNHITRFSIPTSDITSSKYVRMLSGKAVLFSKVSSDSYQFGIGNLTSQNILTENGIVYTIDAYVPYQDNIESFMRKMVGLDSLNKFILSQTKELFHPELSREIGRDSLNNIIYDSVKISTNLVFNAIGALGNEDSIYTAILPDNAAWTEAYNRIAPYYVSAHKTEAAKIQYTQAGFALVKDMVSRGRIYDPNSLGQLITTSGNIFSSPSYLFNGMSPVELSNGLAYVTDLMKFSATDSWFKEIRIEAEDKDLSTGVNMSLYTRYSYGSSFYVSGKTYIWADPNGSSTPSVDFIIPATLSAKYNIYCVFVPEAITGVSYKTLKPYRIKAYLTYMGSNKKMIKLQPLALPCDTTHRNDTTKLLLASNFTFPYSHVDPDENESETVKVRITSNVTTALRDTIYIRSMRIDCIILEPLAQ